MSFLSIDLPYQSDAAQYFSTIADLPWATWLDSGGLDRFDILTASPHHTLVIYGNENREDPFDLLRHSLGKQVVAIDNIPFAGGVVGYLSYDLRNDNHDQQKQNIAINPGCLPVLSVGIFDWALVLDHHLQKAQIVSHQKFSETTELLSIILKKLQSEPPEIKADFKVHGVINSSFSRDSYAKAFQQVQDYLFAGDCYQVNLAQRFVAQASGDSFGAYLKLRKLSPAPYSAFINMPFIQILSTSPERFLRMKNGKVETKPIKGTRPRSKNLQMDIRLAKELSNHPKDRAENLMIVDLLRNDLGKSCIPGSIIVPKLFEVESFKNVHHLVSTVEGTLSDGYDAVNLLKDCFPGGSVTGAPKHRAMQIIAELENHQRDVYCGTIGYLGFDGNMDCNIAIRTLVYSGKYVTCWAGGGIVADSDMDAEYRETLDKASSMLELLKTYGGKLIKQNFAYQAEIKIG